MKTKVTHTPGPWEAEPYDQNPSVFAIKSSNDYENVVDAIHNEANAFLIAAAPELLEALQDALNELRIREYYFKLSPSIIKMRDKIQETIGKATGEQ